MELVKRISVHISTIKAKVHDMTEARKTANLIEDLREKALEYEKKIVPYLEEIRYHIDKLEEIIDNEIWPLPKYRELLFCR
jgi:glutamine synthetase